MTSIAPCRLPAQGQIYDAADFMRHMHWFAQGLTFREAFDRTGRVLTISATPVRNRGRRAVPLQLNHISTPHVDIASAVCASACIPGLIEPVVLLEKGPDGALRPYHRAGSGRVLDQVQCLHGDENECENAACERDLCDGFPSAPAIAPRLHISDEKV